MVRALGKAIGTLVEWEHCVAKRCGFPGKLFFDVTGAAGTHFRISRGRHRMGSIMSALATVGDAAARPMPGVGRSSAAVRHCVGPVAGGQDARTGN